MMHGIPEKEAIQHSTVYLAINRHLSTGWRSYEDEYNRRRWQSPTLSANLAELFTTTPSSPAVRSETGALPMQRRV